MINNKECHKIKDKEIEGDFWRFYVDYEVHYILNKYFRKIVLNLEPHKVSSPKLLLGTMEINLTNIKIFKSFQKF